MKNLVMLAATFSLSLSGCVDAHGSSSFVQSGAQPQISTSSFTYATKDGQPLKLDLIIDNAVDVRGSRPAIIVLFGGGWEGGARTDPAVVSISHHFASLGYAVLTIDYRLGIKIAKDRGEMTAANGVQMYLRAIEWGVEDLFDATSFISEHGSEWNIDPTRFVLLGSSSGATNALVAEYNVANETQMAQSHLPADFRYAGVISMAGAFWLKSNTPLTFKNTPAPIMFFHGAKDQLVTYDEVQGPFSGYGPVAYFRMFPGPENPKWFVDYPQGDHIIAGTPLIDQRLEMQAFLEKFVHKQEKSSIHTIEISKSPKSLVDLLTGLKGS